jgi:hypothetical protein
MRFICSLAVGLLSGAPALSADQSTQEPVSSAVDFLITGNGALTYESALRMVDSAANSGDIGAKRFRVVMWMAKLPHEAHKRSFTNAFLFLRNTPEIDQTEIRKKLPDWTSDQSRLLEEVAGFRYSNHQNPLTDQNECSLSGPKENGLALGFDMSGAFIQSDAPLSTTGFDQMGLRIDKGKYFPGATPESVIRYERAIEAAATLYTHKEITVDRVKQIASQRPIVQKLYVADARGEEMARLLREIALGSNVLARMKTATGAEVTATFELESMEIDGIGKFNLIDHPVYVYARCLLE